MPPFLQRQTITLDFNQGVDTKSNPLTLRAKLLGLLNATLTADYSPRRRNGFTRVGTTVGVGGKGMLAAFQSQLIKTDVTTQKLYALDNSATAGSGVGAAIWRQVGKFTQGTIAKTQVNRGQGFVDQLDMDYGGGYTCYVWRQQAADGTVTGIKCSVVDESTGTAIQSGVDVEVSATVSTPRVVFLTDAFFIFYGNTSSGNLRLKLVTLAAPTALSGATAVATTFSTATNAVMDAVVYGSTVACQWQTDGLGGVYITGFASCTQSGGTPTVTLFNGLPIAEMADKLTGLCMGSFDSSHLFSAYITGGGFGTAGTWTRVVNASFVETGTAPANVDTSSQPGSPSTPSSVTCVLNFSGTTMFVFTDMVGCTSTTPSIRTVAMTNANHVSIGASSMMQSFNPNGAAPYSLGPFIAAKPFLANSAIYLPVFMGNWSAAKPTGQNTFYLVDASGNSVAVALPGNFGISLPTGTYVAGTFFSRPSTPNTTFGQAIPVPEYGQLAFAGAPTVQGVQQVTPIGYSRLNFNVDAAGPALKAVVGKNLLVAGGQLNAYDGQQMTELGFQQFPTISTAIVSAGSGGAGQHLSAGAYQYVAVYEWTDAQGQRHQSAPSFPAMSFTAMASDSATVVVECLTIGTTIKRANTNVVLYRTQVNGTTFTRVNALNAPKASVAGTTVTFTDGAADTVIASQEVLYTTGGVLPNDGPPCCTGIAEHQTRAFLWGLEDPLTFAYSQPEQNGVGLQFSNLLRGRLPSGSGLNITAIASMDDKAIIFTERAKFAMYGTGPNLAGLQNGYTEPERIPSDMGCIEPRSIAVIPTGIIFLSDKGWHLLDRGLNTTYIGADVERYNVTEADIVNGAGVFSALVLPHRKEVRWAVNTLVLVYSYLQAQWSVFNYSTHQPSDMCAFDSGSGLTATWTEVASAQVNQETTAWTDDATGTPAVIPWTLTTANIHLADIGGFQRVCNLHLLGQASSASSMEVQVFCDESTAAAEDLTFLTAGFVPASSSTFRLRHKFKQQKCEQIQLVITDTPTGAGSSQGVELASMALEVGVKKGFVKLPAAQTA